MLTFKQLEAIYWVSRLGTFGAAAEKLNTSQSAISKRITELEELLGLELFDRSRRVAQLTMKGKELLELGEEILDLRDRLLERMGKESSVVRRFRIGVTELVALTWLPRLVQEASRLHPLVSLEPEIDLSITLAEKLSRGDVDFIIVPSILQDPRVIAVPLGTLRLSWMCSPALGLPIHLSLGEIASYPILMQTERSGVDAIFEQWMRSRAIKIRRVFAGNSLTALSTMTVLGFGVSYLPSDYFQDLVSSGLLQIIKTQEPLPEIPYFAVYRGDGAASFAAHIAVLCKALCDFQKPAVVPALMAATEHMNKRDKTG